MFYSDYPEDDLHLSEEAGLLRAIYKQNPHPEELLPAGIHIG
jgi:hypothetical protein